MNGIDLLNVTNDEILNIILSTNTSLNLLNITNDKILNILDILKNSNISCQIIFDSRFFHTIFQDCENIDIVKLCVDYIEHYLQDLFIYQDDMKYTLLHRSLINPNINIAIYLIEYYNINYPYIFTWILYFDETILEYIFWTVGENTTQLIKYIVEILHDTHNEHIIYNSSRIDTIFHTACDLTQYRMYDYFINYFYENKIYSIFATVNQFDETPFYNLCQKVQSKESIIYYLNIIQQCANFDYFLQIILLQINVDNLISIGVLNLNRHLTEKIKIKIYNKILKLICKSSNKIDIINQLSDIQYKYPQLSDYFLDKIIEIKNSSVKASE